MDRSHSLPCYSQKSQLNYDELTIEEPIMFTVKKLAISTLLTGSVLFFPAIHAVASVPQHVVKQQAGGYSVQVGDRIIRE